MLRSVLTLLLVGLYCASADRPALPSLPSELRASDAAKGLVALKAAEGVVRRAARGRPPPLRSVLGGREEAGLVEERPPGPLALLARALVLLVVFLPVLLTALLAWPWPFFRNRVWFPMLTSALATAGTAFIKWGQWASCRPDIFPERLCAALSRLHSQAPTHGFGHTRREVEAACGAPLADAFEAFDPKPFASGSIAQLHRATLPGGRDVAVKVRHPAVVRRIVVDFALSWGWPRSFSWPSLHPTGSVQLGLALGSVALEPALGLFALLYSRARAENMKHHRLPRSALSFTRVTLLGLSQRIDREVAPKGGGFRVKRPDIQRFGPILEFAKRTRAKELELSSCGLSGTWRPCRSHARMTRATRRKPIGDFSHVPRSRDVQARFPSRSGT